MPYKPLFALAFLALTACGGGGGGDDGISGGPEAGNPNRYYVRSVHAIADAPSLRVSGDGRNWGRGIPYATVTGLISQDLGGATSDTVQVVVNSQDLEGNILDQLASQTISVQGNTENSVVVGGNYSDTFVFSVPAVRRAKPVANLYFQFAHAAPELGALDIYVTAPGVDLATTGPFGSLAPFEFTESIEIPYDDTVITLTAAGTLDPVFTSQVLDFDDDPNDSEDGAEWFMAIAPTLFANSSMFKLVGSDNQSTFELYDRVAPAAVRVIQASPDAPAMDVVIGDNFDNPLARSLTFGQRTAPGPVIVSRASLNFTPPGETGTFLYEDTVDSEPGFESTLFLSGDFADLQSPDTAARPRSVVTQARVRFVNITTDFDFITVYLPKAENAGSNRSLVDDLPPTAATDYTAFDPGPYELRITKRTIKLNDDPNDVDEVPVFGPETVNLSGGSVTTVIVFPSGIDGGPELVTIFDDLEP
jgi:hypothetical protein